MTQSDILAIFFHATRCNQFSWGARGEAHTYFYCILMSAKKKKGGTCFGLGFFSNHSIWHFVQNRAQAELPPALHRHRNRSFGD